MDIKIIHALQNARKEQIQAQFSGFFWRSILQQKKKEKKFSKSFFLFSYTRGIFFNKN